MLTKNTNAAKTRVRRRAELGDLVVVAYDEAARCSADPSEVSRLANATVLQWLEAHPSRRRLTRARRL